MSLSDIVQVTITAQTTAPTRVGFGIPLVMAFHTVFPERVRAYTDVADMVTDGFGANDPAVRAVTALLSQNPKPSSVLVGREALTAVQIINVTPVVAALRNSYDYTVTLNGLDATFTSDATASAAEICAGLKIAIDALSENVTVVDNTTYITITADTVADNFRFSVAERQILTQEDVTTDGGFVTDLTAVRLENDTWYSVHPTVLSKAVTVAAAVHVETLKKIMITSSQDDEIYDVSVTDDVASTLQTAGYARTALIYSPKALNEYPGAAWAGKCLPKDPGSITWKFKTLAGVSYEEFTSTEVTTIESKDCNYYTRIAGVNITQQGVTGAGEFIDITRAIDWTAARIQEYVYARLANSDKVPFTDGGVGVIESEVRAVLKEGVGNSVFAASPEPTVTVPLVADVSTTNKANRILPDVVFEATLAGAIHSVVVTGTVSV